MSGWRRNLKLANTNYILAIRAYNYSEFDGLSLLGSYISLSIVGYTWDCSSSPTSSAFSI